MFNRTLNSMIYKESIFNGLHVWIDFLNNLSNIFNNKKHTAIKMRPSDVNRQNAKHFLETVYGRVKAVAPSKFKAGDQVQNSNYQHVFEKSQTPPGQQKFFKSSKYKACHALTIPLSR